MVIAWLQLLQAAVVLLHFSSVVSQEETSLTNGGLPRAVRADGDEPGSSAYTVLSSGGTSQPLEVPRVDVKGASDANPGERTRGTQAPLENGGSEDALDRKAGKALAVDGGNPGLATTSKAAEWVQVVMESQRMALTAKVVGKIIPTAPASLQLQGSGPLHSRLGAEGATAGDLLAAKTLAGKEGLQVSVHERGQSTKGGRDGDATWEGVAEYQDAGDLQLLAQQRLEVPSRIQLVVEIEKLQKGLPILYAFRWGKPGGWFLSSCPLLSLGFLASLRSSSGLQGQ